MGYKITDYKKFGKWFNDYEQERCLEKYEWKGEERFVYKNAKRSQSEDRTVIRKNWIQADLDRFMNKLVKDNVCYHRDDREKVLTASEKYILAKHQNWKCYLSGEKIGRDEYLDGTEIVGHHIVMLNHGGSDTDLDNFALVKVIPHREYHAVNPR